METEELVYVVEVIWRSVTGRAVLTVKSRAGMGVQRVT